MAALSGGDEDDGFYLYRHMLHYDHELLRDFGASPRRKTGFFAPLKELIDPYEPNDYGAIVSGQWERDEKRAVKAGRRESLRLIGWESRPNPGPASVPVPRGTRS